MNILLLLLSLLSLYMYIYIYIYIYVVSLSLPLPPRRRPEAQRPRRSPRRARSGWKRFCLVTTCVCTFRSMSCHFIERAPAERGIYEYIYIYICI